MAKHIIIRGRVQGVFFRKFTQQKAADLHIAGWVRNTPNYCVEIFAQGEPDKLEEFVEWCKVGPDEAQVEAVEITEQDDDRHLRKFSIIY